jgi:hypothetical protein
MTPQEAYTTFRQDRAFLEEKGVSWATESIVPRGYTPDSYRYNYRLAMDAQAGTLSTDPNAGIPTWLTMYTDPSIYQVLFAPTMAAEIFGEVRKGTWVDQTAMFPVVEHTGEVSTYGDYSNNGRAGLNMNFPQRQSYLFQIFKEYGVLEAERAGLARVNWVGEIDKAAAGTLNRFLNLSYFFGIQGLENYGLLNDPNLSAAITPSTKAAGGTAWIVSGKINAQANEIYADIEALYYQLITQTGGLVAQDTKMTLAMSPGSAVALTATNTFNVNVTDLIKKNFPNLSIKTAVQYGVVSSTNPQGISGGNLVQLIADEVEGQDTGYCAYNERLRSFPIIPHESSYRQKQLSGTFGAVVRGPYALSSLLGV